jgi:hypothetical protein
MSEPLRLVQQAAQPIEFRCPICDGAHAAYIFGARQFQIFRCEGCALTFSKSLTRGIDPSSSTQSPTIRVSRRNERDHASLLASLDAVMIDGPVLVVAGSDDRLIPLLKQRGMTIGRVADHEAFSSAEWDQSYHAAIVSTALMRVPDPRAALLKIRKHLTQGAPLLLSVPLLDGTQARLMGRNWHEWQPPNLWYFTRQTLNLLLLSAGFEHVWFRPEHRNYSLDALSERMHGNAEATPWLRRVESVRRLLPQRVRRREFRLPSGTDAVSAIAAPARSECVVSIVVPVFNERATFSTMMDALLVKQLPGMRKEIIVVESNSTDGSRELVQSYRDHPEIRIVLQPAPRGKGNAVREGLRFATGDIVMIQDADLEYDLDDYDALLAPIGSWQSMFVLGSRHQGSWKMRKFNDAPVTAAVFNF